MASDYRSLDSIDGHVSDRNGGPFVPEPPLGAVYLEGLRFRLINRPGVAGAVLQTPL